MALQGPDSGRVFDHACLVVLNFGDPVTLPGLPEGSPHLSGREVCHVRIKLVISYFTSEVEIS